MGQMSPIGVAGPRPPARTFRPTRPIIGALLPALSCCYAYACRPSAVRAHAEVSVPGYPLDAHR